MAANRRWDDWLKVAQLVKVQMVSKDFNAEKWLAGLGVSNPNKSRRPAARQPLTPQANKANFRALKAVFVGE